MKRSAPLGFTLVEIMIVVAIIGIVIAIAAPGFWRARELSRARACQENLTKIAGSVEVYALENAIPAEGFVLLAELYCEDGSGALKRCPICPSGGMYGNMIPLQAGPECSIGSNPIEPRLSHTLAVATGGR